MKHPTRRMLPSRLIYTLVVCFSPASAAQDAVTRDEILELLQTRDAAIIALQNEVRDLTARLRAAERTLEPDESITTRPATLPGANSLSSEPQQEIARLAIDEQAAQRALERTLIQEGALLLPAWQMQLNPSFGSSLSESSFPTVISDAEAQFLGSNSVERTVVRADLAMQLGLPSGAQLELNVPYLGVESSINSQIEGAPFGQTSSRSGSGRGSTTLGIAKTLTRERGWRPDVVGRLQWNTGSGDRMDNGVILGGGFESIGASLSLIKRHDPLAFFGSVSYESFVKEDDLRFGDQFALSFGAALAASPTSSFFASISHLLSDETEIGDRVIEGTDLKSISLNLGASSILSRGILLNVSTGIGLSESAPDYSFQISASMQMNALRNIFSSR